MDRSDLYKIIDFLEKVFEETSIQKYPNLSLWKIHGGVDFRTSLDKKKLTFLQFILDELPNLKLEYSENPNEWIPNTHWPQAFKQTWIVPSDVDIKEFYDMLHLGNWFLYFSRKVSKQEFTFSFSEPENLMDFIKQEKIVFFITAFHDNDPWLIGFG